MKVGIYGGEAFPIYEVFPDGWAEIDVPAEKVEKWREAFKKFAEAQEEIVAELKRNGKERYVWSNPEWDGFHIPEEVQDDAQSIRDDQEEKPTP